MQETPYLQGREHLLEKFKNIPFLKHLNKTCMQEVLSLSKMRRYDPGEMIIREGVFDCWVYIILSGKVRVVKQNKEIVSLDKIGDIFGEMAVIDGEARSASVYAASDTVCLAVDASFLDRLKTEDRNAFYSVFYRLLAEILANRLRSTSEELARIKGDLEAAQSGIRPAAPSSPAPRRA